MYPETAFWGWEPYGEFRRLQRDMNRLFQSAGPGQEVYPAMNIYANEEEAYVTAELPGINPDELSISVNGNRLSVEGRRKLEQMNEDVQCHRLERGEGRFARTVLLPFDIEAEKVSARYNKGVLTITLPREESAKPRKIAITSG